MLLWWSSDCMQSTKLGRPESEKETIFPSSCGGFIDYSWGSSSPPHPWDHLRTASMTSSAESWSVNNCRAVGKLVFLAFCKLFRFFLCWIRTYVGHFGIRCFFLIHSWPWGAVQLVFIKRVSSKTLKPLAFWISWEITAC